MPALRPQKRKRKKITMTYTYRIIIEADERNTFHGYVPALPGCHTWGKTFEATKQNVRDAIRVYLRSLVADKQPIPIDNGVELMETVRLLVSK